MKHRGKIVSSIVIGVILLIFFFRAHTPQQLIKPEVEAQTTNTDWPQFQHDPQHTGRTTVEVTPKTTNPAFTALWIWLDKNHIVKNFVSTSGKSINDNFSDKATFQSTVIFAGQMQPIVANGKTFFGALNGIIYAVNSTTGDNLWDFTTGGPIMHSVAYDPPATTGSGIVVVPSMDGKLYGLDEANGTQKWVYQTGAGINAAPIINNHIVYIGSRDGSFYAINATNGNFVWKYDTRDPNSKFNKAPIVSPAALSEDGSTVFFGAENMYFYALDTTTKAEKWGGPKKLIGQSFLYSWPVVKGNIIIVRTMSSLDGVEFLMESELDTLCGWNGTACTTTPTMDQEKTAIQNWLTQNPHQKTMYVFDVSTGSEPFQVPMGRVSGENFAPFPPVLDNSNRVLSYWRSSRSYFFQDGPAFGTKHCPDVSALDLITGIRVPLKSTLGNNGTCPELDNGFAFTVGGNYLYMENHFRGTVAMNLTTSAITRITHSLSVQDCGNFRGYPYHIIYYGNDGASYLPDTCTLVTNPVPTQIYQEGSGWSGVSIAATGTTKMFYTNETNINAIVGVKGQ